ncbi:MAG TPA: NfeD family protein [Candidatus Nanopelagicales bacterium]|nr:NfeD family protein [Candidatus Nanopelagicales bacterium]
MDAWIVWLIAAGVLVVAELLTTSLVFAMMAGGAASAAIVAALGGGTVFQVAAFAVVSTALLLGVRPIARRHLHTPSSIRTGVAALVGAEAEVLEVVSGKDGRVKLSGEIWSARAYDGHSEFVPGESVRVIEISGATALVG